MTFEGFTPTEEAVALICGAVEGGSPYSMIRVGDGELSILDCENETPERIYHVLKRAFGRREFTEEDLQRQRADLIEAIRNCDMIGFFEPGFRNPMQAKAYSLLGRLGIRDGKVLVRADIHLTLARSGAYRQIIGGRDWLGVVGCRPLNGPLKHTFGVRHVEMWGVPQEAQYRDITGNNRTSLAVRHWPDRYEEVLSTLEAGPGRVVLVGAGHLGKSYCNRVKQLGGVALDVGSTFDVWAGLPNTRKGAFVDIEPLRCGGEITPIEDQCYRCAPDKRPLRFY